MNDEDGTAGRDGGGIREWIETARAERWGLFVDLLFAIIWVTMVDVLFRIIEGPTYAYYMLMLAGIVAYFGFFASLEAAKSETE
ncbi:hypothetical protein [Natrarchaeobaculum aegyptiacum]|uniref:DUF8119 domain-containing protein n=1 Tax=Natrarchaeobaculum aegyptiacum TaxID=745377 RepID=A0A2Z2HYY8_9EURY|nr:hypothetical protein [Natrarchaeobaculum aegyptiacum]ARS88808.1 hypothetical protein B1756_02895 [Natrarchaeobaculum aegyptiacum]